MYEKKSLMLLTSFIAVVTFLLLPSCIPNIPGGNPQPTPCYRDSIVTVWDSLTKSMHTTIVQVPCNGTVTPPPPVDTTPHIQCDTVFIDTTYVQPVYSVVCETFQDSTVCHNVFSHNETITEIFPRITCR